MPTLSSRFRTKVKEDLVSHTGIDPDGEVPVHNGYDTELFKTIEDTAMLQAAKRKYELPERFILWTGQMYPPENLDRLMQAFARIKDEFPHHLVIAHRKSWTARGASSVRSTSVRSRPGCARCSWTPRSGGSRSSAGSRE